MPDTFEHLTLLVDALNRQLKRAGFKVTIIRHSGGYQQPLYITFYLNFWPPINGRSWVRTESFEEETIVYSDNKVAEIKELLNNAYVKLRAPR